LLILEGFWNLEAVSVCLHILSFGTVIKLLPLLGYGYFKPYISEEIRPLLKVMFKIFTNNNF